MVYSAVGWGNIYPCFSAFFALFSSLIFQSISISQVVDSDGQEDVEEDVVTTDEQNDEVDAGDDANALDSAESLDAIVHHHVPILTSEDLNEYHI